jgi:hypothetical protein
MINKILSIIPIISIIVFTEIFYILMCINEKRSNVESDWLNMKMLSLIMGMIITAGLAGIYYLLKTHIWTLLLGTLGVIVIVAFFVANYYIGMAVAKKR